MPGALSIGKKHKEYEYQRATKNDRRRKRLSRDLRKREHALLDEEKKTLKLKVEIKGDIASYLANKTKEDILDLITLNTMIHENIQKMHSDVNAKEYDLVKHLRELYADISKANEILGEDEKSKELIEKVSNAIHKIKSLAITQRQEARHEMRDRQRFSERTILSSREILSKMQRNIRKEKKDAKHLRHLFDIADHLKTSNKKKLKKSMTEFEKVYAKKGEQEIVDEIKRLSFIDNKLVVLDFRDDMETVKKAITILKERQFPQEDMEIIEHELAKAEKLSDDLHRDLKLEARAEKSVAKKAAMAA